LHHTYTLKKKKEKKLHWPVCKENKTPPSTVQIFTSTTMRSKNCPKKVKPNDKIAAKCHARSHSTNPSEGEKKKRSRREIEIEREIISMKVKHNLDLIARE